MKLRIKNNIEIFETMIELLGTSNQEIGEYIDRHRKEISRLNRSIKQVIFAKRLLNKYFGFIDNEKDRKEIIKICEKFPEIRTARQVEVIFYIVKGLTGQQIADQMGTCEKTVKFHKTNIYKSTFVKSQSELIAYYYDNKLKPVVEYSLPFGSLEKWNA